MPCHLSPHERERNDTGRIDVVGRNSKGENVTAELDSIEPLTSEQRTQIAKLFEDIEVVHEHLMCSCSSLGILLRSLNSQQLLMLLKASIRPLIQLNVPPGIFD